MPGKKQLLSAMEELAAQLDIKIRYEKTSARGGLCRHNGKYQIIVDKKASEEFKLNVISEALKNFDLSNLFISPQLREYMEL